MRLKKVDNLEGLKYRDDLSLSANGMLARLLARSNEELSDIDIYSLSNDTRKDIALTFRELRKSKYIIYSSLEDIYYIYLEPQK